MQVTGGSLGRRPPPPPPAPSFHATADEDTFVAVDNIAPSFIQAWFYEADADGDGRVADEEARAFFLRSGLSPAALSTIWRVVKPSSAVVEQGKGLSRRRFSQALRLIAMAQTGVPLTPALATAALGHHTWLAQGRDLLPAPKIAPLSQKQRKRSVSSPTEPPLLDLGADISGITSSSIDDLSMQSSLSFKMLPPQPDGPTPPAAQQPENAQEALITGLEFLGIQPPGPQVQVHHPQPPPPQQQSSLREQPSQPIIPQPSRTSSHAISSVPSLTFSPLGSAFSSGRGGSSSSSAYPSHPQQESKNIYSEGNDDVFGLASLRQPGFTDQGIASSKSETASGASGGTNAPLGTPTTTNVTVRSFPKREGTLESMSRSSKQFASG